MTAGTAVGVVMPPSDGGRDDEDEAGEALAAGDDDTAATDRVSGGLVWHSSLRHTLRLLPPPAGGDSLRILLNSDGDADDDILPRLPYEAGRSHAGGTGPGQPDARRLRDPRQVAQTIGLLYRDAENRYRVTELGIAVRRWLPSLSKENWPVLGRHAAYALAACQLRNPTRSGRRYSVGTEVFPFAFIWRAMLGLDGIISSDELNRAILRTHDVDTLDEAIHRIKRRRETDGPLDDLGKETVTGVAKNDRLIPWISLASFGYLFIQPKDGTGHYRLRPGADRLLTGPSRPGVPHQEFESSAEYIQYLSDAACLPKDLR